MEHYYRVVCADLPQGPIRRSPADAYDAWLRRIDRAGKYDYRTGHDLYGLVSASISCMAIGTTRRACLAADISDSRDGQHRAGQGSYWFREVEDALRDE